LWIQFLASANWRTHLRLSEIGENKKKNVELEKKMKRATLQVCLLQRE